VIGLGGRNVRLFSDSWRVVREINPEEIVREAEQPFKVAIVGSAGVETDSLAQGMLAGAPLAFQPSLVECVVLPDDPTQVETPTADAVVHVIDAGVGFGPSDRRLAVELFAAARPVIFAFQTPAADQTLTQPISSLASARRAVIDLFGSHASQNITYLHPASNGAGGQAILQAILNAVPQKQLAIGRRLPLARLRVASNVIFQTSLANAQFAMLSSLPASFPVLGGMIGAGADFVVLTKNQALMVFRLAALHDKSHAPKLRILAEIAPVVGAGFLWRTVARSIVGLLPTTVSAIPKAAVAFIGTYLIGRAAQCYYATGRKPSRAEMARYSAEAADMWGGVLHGVSAPDRH